MTDAAGAPHVDVTRPAGTPRPPLDPGSRRPDVVVDALAAAALAVLATAGLGHVFADEGYLPVAAAGAGIAAAAGAAVHATRRRDPLVAVVALLVAYPLGSALAAPDRASLGPVPTPETATALLDGLVRSWKDVLTTAPPVGLGGGLGALPYTVAFAAAAGGLLLARHHRSPAAPALPGLAALGVVLVLGTGEPVSLLTQGAGVAVVALLWGAVRANRPRRTAGAPHWPRLLSGSVMLAVVAVAGLVVGPHLPLVAGRDPLVVRDRLVPPFDPRDEPSPLAAFAAYQREGARDEPLFTVAGLPRDSRLRLAAMDAYDGVVWMVGGAAAPASGTFERVGEAILPVPPGVAAHVAVRVERDRPDVWVPTVGATRAVRFEGGRQRQLTEAFRYNRTMRAGAVPGRLRAGDAVTLDARLPLPPDEALARTRALVGAGQLPALPTLPESLTRRASALTVEATTAYDKATALATALHDGTPAMPTYYSDGGPGTEGTAAASASGHSLARLVRFVDARGGLVGNAEQYAATMALMARWLGLPAQVVLGFRPGSGDPPPAAGSGDRALTGGEAQVVRGRDADAWVEIAFDGVGWVTFDPTPPHDRRPDERPTVNQREVDLTQQEPPPPTYLHVPDSLPELVARPPEPPPPPDSALDTAGGVARIVLLLTSPLWLVLAVAGALVGAKRLRARRRRTHGSAAQRLAGAWWEVCDRSRDLGASVPLRATRREVAQALSPTFPGAPPLAARIDEAMFAAPPPAEDVVAAIWERLDVEHRAALERLDLRRRVGVALSPASLRPRRWQRA